MDYTSAQPKFAHNKLHRDWSVITLSQNLSRFISMFLVLTSLLGTAVVCLWFWELTKETKSSLVITIMQAWQEQSWF